MENSVSADQLSEIRDGIKKDAANFPYPYWIAITNMAPGSTYIVLPDTGNLWVYYEWSNAQAQQIMIWHQGGATTPINPGSNTIAVQASDMLVYTLANPASDMIKVVYQYA